MISPLQRVPQKLLDEADQLLPHLKKTQRKNYGSRRDVIASALEKGLAQLRKEMEVANG